MILTMNNRNTTTQLNSVIIDACNEHDILIIKDRIYAVRNLHFGYNYSIKSITLIKSIK